MTIHLSLTDDLVAVGKLKIDDQHHSEVSEYTSGVEQSEALWERPKRGYSLGLQLDAFDQGPIDQLEYLKRKLAGTAGRLWIREPTSSLIVEERFGTGDGATRGFLVPVSGVAADALKFYEDGVWFDAGGRESDANELSEELARATNENLWIPTNASCYQELNYQWMWNGECVEVETGATNTVTLEAKDTERVTAAWPTGTLIFATVALRGDVAQDMKVGIRQYNSVPSSLDISYGTPTAIVPGEWTLVHSGGIAAVSGFDSAAVMIESDGSLDSTDVFFVGGSCLNVYAGGQWFDPSPCARVVQFATAPADGDALTFSGRARRMTRCRLERDNFAHALETVGHVEVARAQFLEVIE
jgi:hypothetical protein